MNDCFSPYCTIVHNAGENCTDAALRVLRAKLTDVSPYADGYGKVTFHRTDGRTVVLDNVAYDGIGTDYGQGRLGTVSATLEDETIVHLPFIEYWTVDF